MGYGDDLPKNLEISNEFARIFNFFENANENFFVTGRAGTGKTTLLKYIRANSKKRIVVLSPTGIAAIKIGGQTIHSFFKFPWGLLEKKDIEMKRGLKDLLSCIDTIIIDEVSMLSGQTLSNSTRSVIQ